MWFILNTITKDNVSVKAAFEIFKKKFGLGELGDDKEWIEWNHLANVVSLLQKKIQDLETLKYES